MARGLKDRFAQNTCQTPRTGDRSSRAGRNCGSRFTNYGDIIDLACIDDDGVDGKIISMHKCTVQWVYVWLPALVPALCVRELSSRVMKRNTSL